MNYKVVLHLVAFLIMLLAGFMVVVSGVSYLMNDPVIAWMGMLKSAAIAMGTGLVMWALTREEIKLSRREGIGIVVFGWVFAVLISGLPFLLCGALQHPVDAIFESCSGLTTTGASVMTNLEEHSRAILLWRAITHLLGGMGILVLVVAIIPYLGVGGMQIFNAEVAGPSKDRLTPRIASTAKALWGVYLLLNVAMIVLLKVGGLNWFDSVCHAFATISTGGFSTRTASIAAFNSVYIETVTIFFMLISGMNFALHFNALRGHVLGYVKDTECRFFVMLWTVAIGLVTLNLVSHGNYDPLHALRHAAFSVTTVVTCTGFATVDFNLWPVLSKAVLVLLFIVGGCAGSTSGGIKQMRLIVLLKKLSREIKTFLRPQTVYSVKIGRSIISQDVVFTISVFFFTYLAALAVGAVAMSWYTADLSTAFTSVISCLANVGPGFSTVGPVENYAHLQNGAKVILSFLMLLGRLEFYTLLVVLLPNFWRK